MIEEICLSGAAHRGIAELGILQCLEDNKLLERSKLKKAVGVSIGSFIIVCYIIGIPIVDLYKYVLELDTKSLKDVSILTQNNSILQGQSLRKWVMSILYTKMSGDMTTLEFYSRYNIHFITSVVSLEIGLEYIDHITRPNITIFDQIISSMTFPIILPPYKVYDYDPKIGLRTYIDGGLLDNFPIHLISKEKSIGILVRKISNENVDYDNIFVYIKRMRDLMNEQINKHPSGDNVIIIDIPDESSINFDLNINEKVNLYCKGYYGLQRKIKENNIIELFRYKHKTSFKEIFSDIIKHFTIVKDSEEAYIHKALGLVSKIQNLDNLLPDSRENLDNQDSHENQENLENLENLEN